MIPRESTDRVERRKCAAQVQRNWMYLQPIFESPDINKQLPAEGKKFATVNKNWCATVTAAKARPVPTQRPQKFNFASTFPRRSSWSSATTRSSSRN